MDRDTAFCRVCKGSPDELHHIFPIHLGGPQSGPTVWLCGTCHTRIHNTANAIFKNKSTDVDSVWMNRAKPLVMRIVRALFEAETTNLDDVQSRIILKVPKKQLRRIHRRKIDLGFKSLEQYLYHLLNKDLPPD